MTFNVNEAHKVFFKLQTDLEIALFILKMFQKKSHYSVPFFHVS